MARLEKDTPTSPTASAISGVLRRAGLPISRSSPTRIRGWHNVTEGYHSSQDGLRVRVDWTVGSDLTRHASNDRALDEIGKAAAALQEGGYLATVANKGGWPHLEVTLPAEPAAPPARPRSTAAGPASLQTAAAAAQQEHAMGTLRHEWRLRSDLDQFVREFASGEAALFNGAFRIQRAGSLDALLQAFGLARGDLEPTGRTPA
jgi:hypothetical protein